MTLRSIWWSSSIKVYIQLRSYILCKFPFYMLLTLFPIFKAITPARSHVYMLVKTVNTSSFWTLPVQWTWPSEWYDLDKYCLNNRHFWLTFGHYPYSGHDLQNDMTFRMVWPSELHDLQNDMTLISTVWTISTFD